MEKDYKKTGWVNGSEPDMDAEHMNNIEDGIDGLYHPEFDDSGTVEGITSFPAFLSTVINKMNPIAFYKNFKAGMKYVLHTGSLINNGLCTETGKYAADATQLNPNIENTLAWKVAKANSDFHDFETGLGIVNVSGSFNTAGFENNGFEVKRVGHTLFINLNAVPKQAGTNLLVAALTGVTPVSQLNYYQYEYDSSHKATFRVLPTSTGAEIYMDTEATGFYAILSCSVLIA